MANLDEAAYKLKLEEFMKSVDYRVARTRQELEDAYAVVYREYLKRNYTEASESGLRCSLYNCLPKATTFIAAVQKVIFATLTIIPDSPLGLPMDEIYEEELSPLRQKGKKLCEISMLASNTDTFRNGVSMMLNSKKLFFIFSLFKLVFDYTRHYLNLDLICITINPKHRLTYEFLLFNEIAGLKNYDKVNGAPAIAMALDLNTAEAECKRPQKEGLYKMFFAQKTEPSRLSEKFVFQPDDLRYFFLEKTGIFKTATLKQLNFIKSCYPSYNFSEILTR